MVTTIETERLVMRRLVEADAPFIVELLNDPDWLRYIGDRGVRTVADAEGYLRKGPIKSYEQFGFGLHRVGKRDDDEPVGLCGLLQRDWLDMPDLGFAFLPAFRERGFAGEAACATLCHARDVLGVSRVAAFCNPDNDRSIRLLEKLGMRYRRRCQPEPESSEVLLFVWDAGERPGPGGI